MLVLGNDAGINVGNSWVQLPAVYLFVMQETNMAHGCAPIPLCTTSPPPAHTPQQSYCSPPLLYCVRCTSLYSTAQHCVSRRWCTVCVTNKDHHGIMVITISYIASRSCFALVPLPPLTWRRFPTWITQLNAAECRCAT
jgi:hypothetical protein